MDNQQRNGTDTMSRRKLLAAFGMAGAAVVTGGALLHPTKGLSSSVAASVYGPDCCDELAQAIGNLEQFRPHDPDVISKLKNETVERAVNLKWFGAKGDGVTDDTAAWESAVAAVPPGGSLYVPPADQAYYSANGFQCDRDDITIFGAGPRSHLTTAAQKITLHLGIRRERCVGATYGFTL